MLKSHNKSNLNTQIKTAVKNVYRKENLFKILFGQAENFDWRLATLTKRPANLPDKTYGAPVGYAYFDIFNTGSRSEKSYDTLRLLQFHSL
jgi:hypothetical protein